MNTRLVLTIFIATIMSMTLMAVALPTGFSRKLLSLFWNREETIILLHTNDVHGAIGKYAKLAAMKDKYEAEGAYVLLLDAGDFIQGDPTVNSNKGDTAIDLMNLCRYDAVALGNHEFDYGFDNLQRLQKFANFPLLAANVLYHNERAVGSHIIFTTPRGTKIGVFGIETPETATKAHPAMIKGITILGQNGLQDLFDCVQNEIDTLREDGCDLVVCLAHLGVDGESVGRRSIDVLEKVHGIDILLDGHSHTVLEDIKKIANGNGIVNGQYVSQTGTKLNNIGKVVIKNKKIQEVTSMPTYKLDITSSYDVYKSAKAVQKYIDKVYGTIFAQTEVYLNGNKEDVRSKETNMGNLVSDAFLWAARKSGIDADCTITSGGGIRAPIAKGPITKKDMNTALPFSNSVTVIEILGKDILEALEVSTFCSPASLGGFPHVSNLEFTLDLTKKYDGGKNYPDSMYQKPASINRVNITSIAGQPFDPERKYLVATNDFNSMGGDTYYPFKMATNNINLGIAMDDAVVNYIKEELKGVVTEEAYGKVAGRITVIEPPKSRISLLWSNIKDFFISIKSVY